MTSIFHSSVGRRSALSILAGAAGAVVAPALAQSNSNIAKKAARTVRIGYQKSSTLITVLKLQGTLEQELAAVGVQPSWHEFTSGLPLLEALNLDNVDVSADVADTVPVFAQAAGAKLTFIAQEAPSPSAQAIVVKLDSPIKTVAGLKGKRIGFTKAAGVHYLLIAVLEKAGLSLRDIDPAYLTPADGRAAFERGAIDAWVVWDPFLSAAQLQSDARVLIDGSGIASYQRYYLARTRYAHQEPKALDVLYSALKKAGQWVKSRPHEAAALLSPGWGLDARIIEQANGRRSYDVREVTRERLAEQQRIADAFLLEKLLPRKVDALDAELFQPGKTKA